MHFRFAFGVIFASAVARADIAPPAGYVESCTVEKQKRSGEECVACGTYFAEPNKCVKEHGVRGFVFRCKTRGGSTWSEVWCKSGSQAALSSMNDPPEAGALGPVDASAATPVTTSQSSSSSSNLQATPTSNATGEPVEIGGNTPIRSGSSQEPPPPEKHGSCGACRIGAPDSNAISPSWLFLVGISAWIARRARRGD